VAEPIDAFRFPLTLDRHTGSVRMEHDYEAYVAQLIRQVLLTAPGERVHRPDFGAGLKRVVFAPTNETTATLVQTTVFQSLEKWLGTILTVEGVTVTFEDSRLDVTVTYVVRARGTRRVLNLEVTR
jgi:phage baseplate assembly protein W